MSLKRIIGVIDGHRLLSDKMLRHPGDYEPHRYRHRHVFIEAVAGWLGRSMGLRPLLRTPFVHAFPHLAFGPPTPSIELCIDWAHRPAEGECHFFLDVSKACTQVCRRLADDLGSRGKLGVPECTSAEAAIVACQAALRRWHEWLPKVETYAGSRVISDLTNLRYMHWPDSSEVELLTYSAATACIDLAKLVPLVRNEAVRLAARLRAVPSWITADPATIAVELEEQLRLADQLEREIDVASVDFEVELRTTSANDNEPLPNRSEKVALKFARTPDAKQKCLEALVAAPDGIPTHDQIANAISLEYQTVKEAMQKLRGAGHVDKIAGVWVTTTKGREHLKVLLGE